MLKISCVSNTVYQSEKTATFNAVLHRVAWTASHSACCSLSLPVRDNIIDARHIYLYISPAIHSTHFISLELVCTCLRTRIYYWQRFLLLSTQHNIQIEFTSHASLTVVDSRLLLDISLFYSLRFFFLRRTYLIWLNEFTSITFFN